jgi:hypothetical protein
MQLHRIWGTFEPGAGCPIHAASSHVWAIRTALSSTRPTNVIPTEVRSTQRRDLLPSPCLKPDTGVPTCSFTACGNIRAKLEPLPKPLPPDEASRWPHVQSPPHSPYSSPPPHPRSQSDIPAPAAHAVRSPPSWPLQISVEAPLLPCRSPIPLLRKVAY